MEKNFTFRQLRLIVEHKNDRNKPFIVAAWEFNYYRLKLASQIFDPICIPILNWLTKKLTK